MSLGGRNDRGRHERIEGEGSKTAIEQEEETMNEDTTSFVEPRWSLAIRESEAFTLHKRIPPQHEISTCFYRNTCYRGSRNGAEGAGWGSGTTGQLAYAAEMLVGDLEPTSQRQKLPLSTLQSRRTRMGGKKKRS